MTKELKAESTMQIEQYSETQEGSDRIQVSSDAATMPRVFAVKKHHATHLHYDFRLAHNGVLLSWVLPEGLSYWPGHHREAIQVGDHSREYAFSERVIHDGPGAGTVMVWDWGTWMPSPGYADVDACLRNGLLKFSLNGERLKGTWTLTSAGLYKNNRRNMIWTLTKEWDPFALSKAATSILKQFPNSVITGRTLREIADEDSNKRKFRNEQQLKLFGE